jgi:hypothetical protein
MPATAAQKKTPEPRPTIEPIAAETPETDWTDISPEMLRINANPPVPVSSAPEVALPSIQDMLREELQKLLPSILGNLPTQPYEAYGKDSIVATRSSTPLPMNEKAFNPPKRYKKHYRCDVSPSLKIQLLDMSSLDVNERPQSTPIPGQWIEFHRGHLYTDDDNVIRQIEWMRNRAMYSPDGQTTLGGNPSIYEDDGAEIFRCTQGCDFVTASRNSWKAHMWATHGTQVE